MLLTINITEKQYEELSPKEKGLIDAAKNATNNAYAPYSNFHVGASLRLKDGTIVTGANQENAAFGAGTCAERSAIFAAQSHWPELAVDAIAIAARNNDGFLKKPISPCGICRQAIVELEQRYKQKVQIMMYGEEIIYIVDSVKDLLPLCFEEF